MFQIKTCYLDVPYEMRSEANKYKCLYLKDQKLWTCRLADDDDEDKLNFIKYYHQVTLDIPFDDKDDAKSKGAKWDANSKCWYSYLGNEELKKYHKLSKN